MGPTPMFTFCSLFLVLRGFGHKNLGGQPPQMFTFCSLFVHFLFTFRLAARLGPGTRAMYPEISVTKISGGSHALEPFRQAAEGFWEGFPRTLDFSELEVGRDHKDLLLQLLFRNCLFGLGKGGSTSGPPRNAAATGPTPMFTFC